MCSILQEVSNCRICYELLGYNQFIPSKYKLNSTIIAESENWAVIPTIGALVEGYILIVNKSHYCSLADCPSKQYDELQYVFDQCCLSIKNVYENDWQAFEHGTLSSNVKGSNSIDHVHLHLLPYVGDIKSELKKTSTNIFKVNSFYDLKGKAFKYNTPYLYYSDYKNDNVYVSACEDVFPSQYFRIQIANAIGKSIYWNWRDYPNWENFIKTYHKLHGTIHL